MRASTFQICGRCSVFPITAQSPAYAREQSYLLATIMQSSALPVLIIGAGISGLSLAQGCRKHGIPYQLFERDESVAARSAGWGLTLNWCLPVFRSLMPQDVADGLGETLVNKAAVNAGEKGSFTFFDLATGEAKWRVPASERLRVSRERLRRLMLTGSVVQWGKTVVDLQYADDSITVHFSDGSTATGSLVVGCDGAHSQIRKLCHPDEHQNKPLPIRFIGAGPRYPVSTAESMRKLDPFFLQGSSSKSDVFLWFSFLDVPGDPDTVSPERRSPEDSEMCRCQVMTSWPYRPGFLGREKPVEMPQTDKEKLAMMSSLAESFVDPFRSIVQQIPPDSEVKEIALADWMPRSTINTELGKQCAGRVALVGDAAHAMVMYRGEGANHAVVDAGRLIDLLKPLYEADEPIKNDVMKAAMQEYEEEMVERTALAVLASRQACMDAHDFKRLNDQSPLVRRRLMRADLEATETAM